MYINEIDVGELISLMEADTEQLEIIDVREAREVAQGAIPNARHIPMATLPLRLQEISADKQVVLVCRSGARSGQCCAWLMQNGRDNVINLRGGMMSWTGSGLQLGLPKSA
ncbi:rhodanese-like domain-containing protein [Sulfuriflexus sp.]|uniref:rhodanese-like domain-containing protein n=1 Tax=Sulfuriflexus sp. TaxID=2015443 RepID=UPI0028CEAB06|nr:rhodanese-like domain-containing protein [Sulfuriflexus sp.]MDT8403882.1 rhodanese-like domain-containing protein [Sulfuriflexus sp.]